MIIPVELVQGKHVRHRQENRQVNAIFVCVKVGKTVRKTVIYLPDLLIGYTLKMNC